MPLPSLPSYRVPLPKDFAAELAECTTSLPDWQLSEGLLSAESSTAARRALSELSYTAEFVATCDRLLNSPRSEGFAVLELAGLLDAAGSAEIGLHAVTALVSLIAPRCGPSTGGLCGNRWAPT